MEFREANIDDIDEIMSLLEGAKDYLKNKNIEQWNNGYPNRDIVMEDIEKGNSYILLEDGKVIGTLAAIFGKDETYNEIYDGDWIFDNDDYVVIHRIAVDDEYKGKGLASKMFKNIEKMAIKKNTSSIRIDTHKKNNPMLNFIEKNGFRYCGIIYVADGGERVAYEKILKC